MVFDIYALSQKCLKVQRVTMKNNDVVEHHGTQIVFCDKMINYQRI